MQTTLKTQHKTTLKLTYEFHKVLEYKINIWKSVAFLLTDYPKIKLRKQSQWLQNQKE